MAPLTLKPDYPPEPLNGAYGLYCFQKVVLTATVDDPGVNPGTLVYFSNVGDGPGLELHPLGNNWQPAPYPHQDDAVGVELSNEDGGNGLQAQLAVIVDGLVPGNGTTDAYILKNDHITYQSEEVVFTVKQGHAVCPTYVDDFILAFSESDQSPDNPGNNFLYYGFQVTDPDTRVGLRNICVRVQPSIGTPNAMRGVLLYEQYGGGKPLDSNRSLDLLTDDEGVAELYLCPKGGVSSIGSLNWKVGTDEGSLGPFMIVDPNREWSTLGAPQTEDPVPLDGSPTALAHIPQYLNIKPYQWVFLLCNGRFQSSKVLTESDIGGGVDLTLPFQKSILRSESYPYADPTLNGLLYVVYSVDIRVSSEWAFAATGTPPQVQPDPGLNPTLSPPKLMGNLDGWPINCDTLSKELRIRIPLDQPEIEVDDEIRIQVYLNGYRKGSEETLGLKMSGPWRLLVTQHDFDVGFIEWPFVPIPFWGFGQMPATGELGSMRVNYGVVRGAQGILYLSCDLLIGIDTVFPSGSVSEPF